MTSLHAPTDLTQCTAEQLLHLYRSGQASPVDATKALLARIEKLNPRLNAFTLVDEKVAMNCAKASSGRVGRYTRVHQRFDSHTRLAHIARQPNRRSQPGLGG